MFNAREDPFFALFETQETLSFEKQRGDKRSLTPRRRAHTVARRKINRKLVLGPPSSQFI